MSAAPVLVIDNAPSTPADVGDIAAIALGEVMADEALFAVRAGAPLERFWSGYIALGAHARRAGPAAKAYLLRIGREAAETAP